MNIKAIGRSTIAANAQPERPARGRFYVWLGAMVTIYDTTDNAIERVVQGGRRMRGEVQQTVWGGKPAQMLKTSIRDRLDIPSRAEIEAVDAKLGTVLRRLDAVTTESE